MTEEFSFYIGGISNTSPRTEPMQATEFLERIKSDIYKHDIEFIRKRHKEGATKKDLDELKSGLDYATFAGVFTSRENANLVEMSGLMLVDFDDIDADTLSELRNPSSLRYLGKDNRIHVFFVSPKGNGLKIGVRIPKQKDKYRSYYVAFAETMFVEFGLPLSTFDKSTKDIPRACYVSYDPEAYHNPESVVFDWTRSEAEFSALCKIVAKHSKEDVFKQMEVFEKWRERTRQGKEEEYKRALDFLKQDARVERGESRQEKKQNKEEVVETSLIVDDENKFMVEQLFDGKKSFFCIYDANKKEFDFTDSIDVGSHKYVPITSEEVTKKAVLLPSSPLEYDSDEKLDKEIKQFIHKWLDIPEDIMQFALWNIKRSWVFERFHTLNYLRAMGDLGQGKSRFLATLGHIHYKPILTSGATTSAPVFRIIDRWRGTMIFDEGDIKITDETALIIKIINMGYERGTFVMRCDQNNADIIRFFDPYCPKIIATRKPFEDKAVESRCITHVMQGTNRRDIKLNLDDEFNKEAQTIRDKLLMWRFRNYFNIKHDATRHDFGVELEPRMEQIVTSFMSLFSNDAKAMNDFKLFIKAKQEEITEERQDTIQGKIVKAIKDLMNEGSLKISLKDIVEKANFRDSKGNYWNVNALKKYMKELGFEKGTTEWIEGESKRCISLNSAHLQNIFKRYGYLEKTDEKEKPDEKPYAAHASDAPYGDKANQHNDNKEAEKGAEHSASVRSVSSERSVSKCPSCGEAGLLLNYNHDKVLICTQCHMNKLKTERPKEWHVEGGRTATRIQEGGQDGQA